MIGLFGYAVVTTAATWLLLVIGGTVNPTSSSMACPDWMFVPTCNGQVFPAMQGGVLFEHGHRLVATLVGILTVGLAVWAWRRASVDATTRKLAWLALGLVVVQGTFGGVTVLLNLSVAISTLHLLTAFSFFCLLILIAFRLRFDGAPPAETRSPAGRGLVATAAVLVFAEVLLGGTVRHTGAGLVCGDDWMLCAGSAWPSFSLGQLHMTHRLVAYTLVPLLIAVTFVYRRRAAGAGMKLAKRISLLPAILVVLQVLLGLTTVATGRNVALVTLHTATGALLLASLVALYLALGPLGAMVPRRMEAAVG